MSFNDKVLLLPDAGKLSGRQAEVDIDNAMAPRAGEVVVVLASTTDAIVMSAIGKFDAGEQSHARQFFDRAVHGGAAYARLDLAEFLPQILNGEVCAAAFEIDQAFRDQFARARVALAQLVESRINFLC